MSLLKWKEMAEKRSELGKQINEVRQAIKKQSISDQVGEVEAAKLFKPITPGLRELTVPKASLRRIAKEKGPVPDYGIAIDDKVPDYGLEDQFGDQVLPQDEKQIAPKPPSYKDVLDEIASGEKNIYINPDYKFDLTLPTIYEEGEEGIDYAILEEDGINEVLDNAGVPNYNDVESRLKEPEMNDTRRKAYLKKIIKDASSERNGLNGYKMDVIKKSNRGIYTESEKQFRLKIISDARKVLTDYINNNKQKLESIKGSGLKRRKKGKRGGQIMFFNDPTEMMKKLELIIGSMPAGNNSIELRNTGVAILDMLLRNSGLNRPQYNKLYKNYFSTK